MNTSDILELVRAGYTKAEIESLSGAEIQKENTESAKQEEVKTEEVRIEENKTEENKTEEVKPDNGYKELLQAVNSLKETVKAIQADNAKKASVELPQKETADSAIRSFFEEMPK